MRRWAVLCGKVGHMNTQALTDLAAFRAALYSAFTLRQDALFELTDALLAAGPVGSLPSLEPPSISPSRMGQSL